MDCPKCGGDMWDNREKKKNPKAPDYKCKDKDCDGVIWPPRGSKSTAAPQSHATGRTGTGNGHSDDRSNRIERQHSQEMAIRYCVMMGGLPKSDEQMSNTDKLKLMIDWFQRDIGRSPEKQQSPTQGDPSDYGDGSPDEPDF